MQSFKDEYLKKCMDLACKPIMCLIEELDAAIEAGYVSRMLRELHFPHRRSLF